MRAAIHLAIVGLTLVLHIGSVAAQETSAPGSNTTPAARLKALRALQPGDRGGIEGPPISLNSTDPAHKDYFEQLRRQIQGKWSYPFEAANKAVGGSLLIEFGILRDGTLQFIEVRRSSGVIVLDEYAVSAVKLASPFPPVPEPLVRGTGIAVEALFNYVSSIIPWRP